MTGMDATGASMALAVAPEPSADWDDFVLNCPGASTYFQSGWPLIARDAFRHRTFFIEARGPQGQLAGYGSQAAAGGMFWLRRKRFWGSYFALIWRRRFQVASG